MVKVPACRNKEEEHLSDEHNQVCYEQKIGLYEALTHNNPKVILVEIGEDRQSVPLLKEIPAHKATTRFNILRSHSLTEKCLFYSLCRENHKSTKNIYI